MQIERGTLNRITVMARGILSPSNWLLWFWDPERNASVYCVTQSETTGSMMLLPFTETDTPTALDGEVKLSPRGNWVVRVYEQVSATNLDPDSAGRFVKEIDVLVVGDPAQDGGWSGETGDGGDCDPTTVNGTEIDGQTVTVTQGGVEVGTVNPVTGDVEVPECENCPFDIELYVDAVLVDTIDDVDPCVNNTLNINWN